MSMSAVLMPRARLSQADALARVILLRLARWSGIGLGLLIILAGILISPLPGPGGIPIIVVGLMFVLRNSFWARRQFVRIQRRHPRYFFPIRRLLRRRPEVLPVFWQQALRMERMVLRKKQWRVARRARLRLMRRRR